jgi:hypothetical protein
MAERIRATTGCQETAQGISGRSVVTKHFFRTFTMLIPIIILHLLGLATAGYLAAPDNGQEAGYTGAGGAAGHPKRETVVSLCH